jgi:hypothetical protein
MESIMNYINESLRKTDIDDFKKVARWTIDFVYNEGILPYNDEHLNDYVNGDKEPDYKEVIDITISEFKKFIPAKILSELKKYPKTSYKDEFELAILNAMNRILHPNK